MLELIVAMAVVTALASLWLPAVDRARETARKFSLSNNFQILSRLALTREREGVSVCLAGGNSDVG